MCDLVKRTFNDRMFIDLSEALEAEGVTAGERQGLLLGVIVLLETHTTFKYRIHSFFQLFYYYIDLLIHTCH